MVENGGEDDGTNDEVRNEVVSLFGTFLTPSIFTTAGPENFSVSLYGRTLTGEGEVPDFDEDPRDEIDELSIFVSGRMHGLGLTIGFSEGSEFEFSEPVIWSLDYKVGLLEESRKLDAAVDFQYSMITLLHEDEIKVSAGGFGVFSISGLVSTNIPLVEPYAGLTLNYIYLNAEEEFISLLKLVPKIGLQVKPLRMFRVGTEIKLISNEHLDSAWIWDLGANMRF
jgi:hypothetical protein